MKILIAPLNWGLGHASRCLPLIARHLEAGDDVVLGGDGESLALLRKHYPALRYLPLAPLQLRYSAGNSQVGAICRALPRLIRFSLQDHLLLEALQAKEQFDLIISDNRFCLYVRGARCVYITHQLLIKLPPALRWAEPLLHRLHGRIIRRFDECWVPDYAAAPGLSGDLSHRYPLPANARFIGPLSRFNPSSSSGTSGISGPAGPSAPPFVLCILSGPEPHRTLLERAVVNEYLGRPEKVLIVRGKPQAPPTVSRKQNITLVPYFSDRDLREALLTASTIISRSGYSSIMDYDALGLFEKQRQGAVSLRLLPTPGQPEQEYLSTLLP